MSHVNTDRITGYEMKRSPFATEMRLSAGNLIETGKLYTAAARIFWLNSFITAGPATVWLRLLDRAENAENFRHSVILSPTVRRLQIYQVSQSLSINETAKVDFLSYNDYDKTSRICLFV